MRELIFHPAARAEAVAASIRLESERAGYGERSELELGELCDLIVRYPRSGTPLPAYPAELDVRAYRMSTFRYSLIVAIVDGVAVVQAVAHQHRRPGYWRKRLP